MLGQLSHNYYFIRTYDGCQNDAFTFDDDDWKSENADRFYGSDPIINALKCPVVHYTKLKCLKNDYLTYGSLDAVSAELANFLQDKIHAEFIPMQGVYKGEPYTERQFYLVHLLDHLEPLDLTRSIYGKFTNESTGKTFIVDIDKLIIDHYKTNHSAAFEMSPLGFYLYREDICRAILSAGFKGMSFIPIERYRQTIAEDLSHYELRV
jgi:hypothetical protein